MHRSLNMNMHGGDMYVTKVLILPSEVPRGANMISKRSMCHIFTSLGFTKCMLWIYSYIAQNEPVESSFSYLCICIYLPTHTHTCKLIPYISSKKDYIAKLKHKERKICGFPFPILSSLQEEKNLEEILSINIIILNKKAN